MHNVSDISEYSMYAGLNLFAHNLHAAASQLFWKSRPSEVKDYIVV